MALIDPLEAEQSILGCMIMDSSVLPDIFSFLETDDFKYKENQNLFSICKELFSSNLTVDLITVMGKFGETPEHKVFITDLCRIVPSIKPYKEYMRLVKENSQRRKAQNFCLLLLEQIEENFEMSDCLSTACDITQSLSEKSNESSYTALEGFYAVYSELGKPIKYISTGFSRLDKHVRIDKGDYIVVAGRPSMGKTAFTLQMMLNMSKSYKAVYFSLETSKKKVFERLISSSAGIPLSQLKDRNIKDYANLARFSDQFCKLNFSVVESAGWTVDKIQATAVQENADIIFIDYLSLINGNGKGIYEQVTKISKDLHIMAQTRKIAVVALSQLSRNNTGEPTMSDLRESGQIEQDADAIFILYSQEDSPESRILKIAKNKEGITGKIPFSFIGELQRFCELETRYG